MISFMAKNGNTAIISLVSCEQSKLNAALNGGDMISLDSMFNEINKDSKITHVVLRLTYADDEKKVLDFFNEVKNNQKKTEDDDSDKEETQVQKNNEQNDIKNNEIKQRHKNDFICPECGNEDALVDKNGNKYPCLSCIQIDLGKKMQDKYAKEYSKVVEKNNLLIGELVSALKK